MTTPDIVRSGNDHDGIAYVRKQGKGCGTFRNGDVLKERLQTRYVRMCVRTDPDDLSAPQSTTKIRILAGRGLADSSMLFPDQTGTANSSSTIAPVVQTQTANSKQ